MERVSISNPISREKLLTLAEAMFGNLVKAVIDIEKEVMVVGGELHSDEETMLIQEGSDQSNLWGINFYPELPEEDWLEFDSMINMRPSQGNRSRGVEDPTIRERIRLTVSKLIK